MILCAVNRAQDITNILLLLRNDTLGRNVTDMNYIDKIREITETYELDDANKSVLSKPSFIIALGLDDQMVADMRRELADRWMSSKSYVYFCVINPQAERNGYVLNNCPGTSKMHEFDIDVASAGVDDYENNNVKAQLSFYLLRMAGDAMRKLGNLGRGISVNVICRADSDQSLWAGRINMILHKIIVGQGGDIEYSSLISLFPGQILDKKVQLSKFSENCSKWKSEIPDEKLFPVLDDGKIKRPIELESVKDLYSTGEKSVFTRYLYIDAYDSEKNEITDKQKTHLAVLLSDATVIDEDAWDQQDDNSETCRSFSAYLFPKYADRHEIDIALALEICQQRYEDEQKNVEINKIRHQISDSFRKLYAELHRMDAATISDVNGFIIHKGDDMLTGKMQEMSYTDVEKIIFGDGIKNEHDYFWVRTLIQFKNSLPDWRNSVREILKSIKDPEQLRVLSEQFRPYDISNEVSHISAPQEKIKIGKVAADKRDTVITQLRTGILEHIYRPALANREMAVFMRSRFAKDSVVSAVLDFDMETEYAQMLEEREIQLKKVCGRVEEFKQETQTVIEAFETEVRYKLGDHLSKGYVREERMSRIEEVIKDEGIFKSYIEMLEGPEKKHDSIVRVLLNSVYKSFIDNEFAPIEIDTEGCDYNTRLACRIHGAVPQNGYVGVIGNGLDKELHYYIAAIDHETQILAMQ